jgi:hypothetical protein
MLSGSRGRRFESSHPDLGKNGTNNTIKGFQQGFQALVGVLLFLVKGCLGVLRHDVFTTIFTTDESYSRNQKIRVFIRPPAKVLAGDPSIISILHLAIGLSQEVY